jgi:hypothetical protein
MRAIVFDRVPKPLKILSAKLLLCYKLSCYCCCCAAELQVPTGHCLPPVMRRRFPGHSLCCPSHSQATGKSSRQWASVSAHSKGAVA